MGDCRPMTKALSIALMSAQALPENLSEAPEWIHLLPATDLAITTRDGRGPYRVNDAARLVEDSFAEFDRLPLDENHATDIAAPKGGSAPARGWITALQARSDGIWGKVEWTPAGRELITTHAYRYISPVIGHSSDGRINRILRASLVNRPNMRGLTALHQEGAMALQQRLAELIGLNAEASEDDLIAAITGMKAKGGDDAVALQSQLVEIGTALGVTNGDGTAILIAAKAARETTPDQLVALQSELTKVTTNFNALSDSVLRDKATSFVDSHLGRAGVKPLRDHYITRHMADPESVAKELAALPMVAGAVPPSGRPPEEISTHAANPQELVSRATAYQKKMADAGQNMTYASAVRAVSDGKDKA